MTTARTWTIVRRIGIAFAVYAPFWVVLTGLAAWHLSKVAEHIVLSMPKDGSWVVLTPVSYTLYLIPILVPLVLIVYSSLTTLLLVRPESSEAQFRVQVLRNEILMLAGVGISLVLTNFPLSRGIR